MRKYWVLYWTSTQNTLTYRGPLAVWFISNMVSLATVVAVWLAVQAGSLIGGYSKGELITYYIISTFWWWFTGWFPFYWIVDDIASGEIVGNALLKPVSFYLQTFMKEAGWHTVGFFIGIIAIGVVDLALGNYFVFRLTIFSAIPFLLATAMSIMITLTISICLGLIGFWTTKVGPIDGLFWFGYSLLGGQFVPVSFFPGFSRLVVDGLPFRYMFSFPIEIYLGKLTSAEMFQGFSVAVVWLFLLFLIYKWLWNHGRLVYTSFGQ